MLICETVWKNSRRLYLWDRNPADIQHSVCLPKQSHSLRWAQTDSLLLLCFHNTNQLTSKLKLEIWLLRKNPKFKNSKSKSLLLCFSLSLSLSFLLILNFFRILSWTHRISKTKIRDIKWRWNSCWKSSATFKIVWISLAERPQRDCHYSVRCQSISSAVLANAALAYHLTPQIHPSRIHRRIRITLRYHHLRVVITSRIIIVISIPFLIALLL